MNNNEIEKLIKSKQKYHQLFYRNEYFCDIDYVDFLHLRVLVANGELDYKDYYILAEDNVKVRIDKNGEISDGYLPNFELVTQLLLDLI